MSFNTSVDRSGEYPVRTFSDRAVLPSGQTIKIEFQEDWTRKKYYYNVYLCTMDKRKSESHTRLKMTGKDGLKGLLWARNKIQEFETFIADTNKGVPSIIMCRWDDNRRRNAYEFGLKRYGYKFGMIFGSKALYKTV